MAKDADFDTRRKIKRHPEIGCIFGKSGCIRCKVKREKIELAHSMLIAIYHILKDNIPFVDLGSEYYNQFNKERKINVYLKRLKALGWESDTAAVSLPA